METNMLLCHDILSETVKPKLSFSKRLNFEKWKKQVKEKFVELIGLNEIQKNVCEQNIEIVAQNKKDGYVEIEFRFESETCCAIPCYLLIPDMGDKKYPVVITLHGHNTGVHNTVGIKRNYVDNREEHSDYAVQAVKRGYAALAIELRGMGETAAKDADFRWVKLGLFQESSNCYYASVCAALLGRTLVGERCFDVVRAIDALSNFSNVDVDKIVAIGDEVGGTTAYYAAAIDDRIKGVICARGFCSYVDSLFKFYHCSCNYIPKVYENFDLQDLSCLIAPRPLSIVAGKRYDRYPFADVERAFSTVVNIYEKAGAQDQCELCASDMRFWDEKTVFGQVEKQFTMIDREN